MKSHKNKYNTVKKSLKQIGSSEDPNLNTEPLYPILIERGLSLAFLKRILELKQQSIEGNDFEKTDANELLQGLKLLTGRDNFNIQDYVKYIFTEWKINFNSNEAILKYPLSINKIHERNMTINKHDRLDL